MTPRDFFSSKNPDDGFDWSEADRPDTAVDVTLTHAWDDLTDAFDEVRGRHLRELMAADGRR